MDIKTEVEQLINAKFLLAKDILGIIQSNDSSSADSLSPLWLEKFQRGQSIGIDDQMKIVDAVNELMTGKNVLVLRDKGHKSWFCLHYCCGDEPNAQKIVFFSPTSRFGWPTFNKFKQEIDQKVIEWCPFKVPNPAELYNKGNCKTSSNPSEQFVQTLVYAFGCCLNYPNCYVEPFGESKERVRRAISKALMDKKMPTIEEVWGTQPANGN